MTNTSTTPPASVSPTTPGARSIRDVLLEGGQIEMPIMRTDLFRVQLRNLSGSPQLGRLHVLANVFPRVNGFRTLLLNSIPADESGTPYKIGQRHPVDLGERSVMIEPLGLFELIGFTEDGRAAEFRRCDLPSPFDRAGE